MTMKIIYWSATGNTEAMANAIFEGAKNAGAEVELFSVDSISAQDALSADLLALGCPAMGCEVLEESEFEPFFAELEGNLSGKKVALFGSYDWGDGQWMRDWKSRVCDAGGILFKNEGLIINNTPDQDGLNDCANFGAGFAAF